MMVNLDSKGSDGGAGLFNLVSNLGRDVYHAGNLAAGQVYNLPTQAAAAVNTATGSIAAIPESLAVLSGQAAAIPEQIAAAVPEQFAAISGQVAEAMPEQLTALPGQLAAISGQVAAAVPAQLAAVPEQLAAISGQVAGATAGAIGHGIRRFGQTISSAGNVISSLPNFSMFRF